MSKAPDPFTFGPLALLERSSRERLRKLATKRQLDVGEMLIDERHPADEAYVIVDGTLRVVGTVELRTLAIVSAPSLVGELVFFDEQEKAASIVADTPCSVFVLPGRDLRQLMDEQPVFAVAMRERTDMWLADVFLKRQSPLRDLPSDIVASLASQLRPRMLAKDQLVEGSDDDWYLVRRGALEPVDGGERTDAGDFIQRQRGVGYGAVGETWLYELRLTDVAREIVRYQGRLREITETIADRTRVKLSPNLAIVHDSRLGGALVRDRHNRAVVSERVAALLPAIDGHTDVTRLTELTGLARGPVIEALAVLIAAGLANDESRWPDFRPD
jgi:CRP-like cAMP-binding protein